VNKDTTNFTVAMEHVESIKWQHQLSLNESSHHYLKEKNLALKHFIESAKLNSIFNSISEK